MKRIIIILLLLPVLFACDSTIDDKELLEEAQTALSLPEVVDQDLHLLTDGLHGVRIEWQSANEEVLSSDGKISPKETDVEVSLIATLFLNDQKMQKEFSIVVKGKPVPQSVNYTKDYRFVMDETQAKAYTYYKGFLYPGLRDKKGQEHTLFKENKTTGKSINVKLYGAKPNDSTFDNTKAFQNAIAAASFGDEIFVPKGKYYLKSAAVESPYYAHIQLKSGVNLRGESKEESILVSSFENKEYVHKTYGKKTATLICGNMKNCTISDLGFSANTDDSCLPKDINDTKVNNPTGNQYAPAFGIVAYNNNFQNVTENIFIHNVYIEYFQYDGIRLYCTRNCKISDSTITKATDIGGGGAGYGIEIRGYGHEYYKYIDTNLDSCYNLVEGVEVLGPYIRHGIILSYMTHNNLFYNNKVLDTADDAFDVHGQDEFLNVFSHNYAKGSRRGAGLGLGNTGSTHDESGYGNILYQNEFIECKYGITVARGTKFTQIIKNKIQGCTYGIHINNGPHTTQEGNTIS